MISDLELKQELEQENLRINNLHNQISQVNKKRISRTNTKSPSPINSAEKVNTDKQLLELKAQQRK